MKTLKLLAWSPPERAIPRNELKSKLPAHLGDKIPGESPRKILSSIQKALPKTIDAAYASYTQRKQNTRWSIIGVPSNELESGHVAAISIRLTQEGNTTYDRTSEPLGCAFIDHDGQVMARGPQWLHAAVQDAEAMTQGKIQNGNLKKIIDGMLRDAGAWQHAKGTWLMQCDGETIPVLRKVLSEYGADIMPITVIVGVDTDNTTEVIQSFCRHIADDIQTHVSRIHSSIEEQKKFVDGHKKQPIRFTPLQKSQDKLEESLAHLTELRSTLDISVQGVASLDKDLELLFANGVQVSQTYDQVMRIDRTSDAVPLDATLALECVEEKMKSGDTPEVRWPLLRVDTEDPATVDEEKSEDNIELKATKVVEPIVTSVEDIDFGF
jgi:hypothetical protein